MAQRASAAGLPAELIAQVTARAKAAMQEHTAELEARLEQAARRAQKAEARVVELQGSLRARESEVAAARDEASEARASLQQSHESSRSAAQTQQQTSAGAQRAELDAAYRKNEDLEASLHSVSTKARETELEWRSRYNDLEASLSDEQAKRASAERLVEHVSERYDGASSESGDAQRSIDESAREHRTELQALKESLHTELLTEREEREAAEERGVVILGQLERSERELAQAKSALARTVASHSRAHGDTKSSTDEALLKESLRVKSAELETSRARQSLALKEDELAHASEQLAHVMEELSHANSEAGGNKASHERKSARLEAQVRDLEKRWAAREQEWTEKTGQVVAQATALMQEREQLRAELADAHRQRMSEAAAAASLRDEAAEQLDELGKARESASGAREAGAQACEHLRGDLGAEITQLRLDAQECKMRTAVADRTAEASKAELGHTSRSLQAAQESLHEQTRVGATQAVALRTAVEKAERTSADLSEKCAALEAERDRAMRQGEASNKRLCEAANENEASARALRASLEVAERNAATATEALSRSEARLADAESAALAAEEDHEAGREEDREQIRRSVAIRASLEVEVEGLQSDVANLEALNGMLKAQVVVVETEARRMQLRFAQASAKLGVVLTPAQQGKLQQDVDATTRRHDSAAAALKMPPKAIAPTPTGAGNSSGGAKRPGESWSDYYARSNSGWAR